MDEIGDQRKGKMNMRQLNTGNKSEVLRKLQERSSVHFEKVLPASSVNQKGPKGESRLTLPAWFVREHGGKLLKHAVLRFQSSLAYNSWTVSLSIEHKTGRTAAPALVRFRSGWQAFVSFNGLLEGDTLVFSLTAMSEFEVYLFRDCSSGGRPNLRSGRDPAIGHDKFDMMSGVDTKGDPERQFDVRMKKENEYQDSALADTSRNRQLPPFLEKPAVSNIHLPERGRSSDFVETPTKFWKRCSSRLQSVDKLQGIREDSKASNVLHSSKESFENDLQQTKMHQGKVFFEKKLTASSLPPRSTMTLPKLFVQQYGDKIQKYVTLRNAENGKMWTVKINIMFHHNRPQACFYRGWKDFIANNDLVIGDRLTFVLVAKSLFHVFILRIGVNPGISVQRPNRWSHNPPPPQRETKMSPVPQRGCKISADGCPKTENPLSGTWLAKNTAVETYSAKVASDSPDCSQSPSDMDSHYFEPMVQQMELECVSEAINSSAGLDQDQSMLPHFLKRTTRSSNLEIPASFLTTNYTRLGTRVQLQGLHDESPSALSIAVLSTPRDM